MEHSSKGSCSFVLWAALASTVSLCAEMMGMWWKPHPRGGEWLWAPHSTQGDIQDEIKKSLPGGVFQRLWVLLWQCCSAETSTELLPKPDPKHVTPWAGGGQVLVWDRDPLGAHPRAPGPSEPSKRRCQAEIQEAPKVEGGQAGGTGGGRGQTGKGVGPTRPKILFTAEVDTVR